MVGGGLLSSAPLPRNPHRDKQARQISNQNRILNPKASPKTKGNERQKQAEKRDDYHSDNRPYPQVADNMGPIAVVETHTRNIHSKNTVTVGIDFIFIVISGELFFHKKPEVNSQSNA